jgi:uncharacterized protein YdhG (YjbR/CyaY superfamily)
MTPPGTVSEYIASAPPQSRAALRQIRAAIRKAAPGITERISYRIPTFDLEGKYLLYMAGFKEHVSIYPVTAGLIAAFGAELRPYRSGKGTLRFALGEPLPVALITRLAKVRVQERRATTGRKATKRRVK